MLVGTFAGPALDSFTSGTMISCAGIWGATLEERKGFFADLFGIYGPGDYAELHHQKD